MKETARLADMERLETRRDILARSHARAVAQQRRLLEDKNSNIAAAIAANAAVAEIEAELAMVESTLNRFRKHK
jgi:hypothetical protein